MSKTNEIEKIIFYKDDSSNKNKEGAYVIYADKIICKVSKEKGKDLVRTLLTDEIKTIAELKEKGKVEFVSKNELEEILKDYEEDINEKADKNNKKSKMRVCAKILAIGLSVTAIGAIIKNYDKLFNKNQESTDNIDPSEDTDNTIYSLLTSETNSIKKQFIYNSLEYLKYYNHEFANICSENDKDTRLAHSWEEIVSQQLIYNNYTGEELIQIFDYYNFDINVLYGAYLSSMKQDMQAHIVQNVTLNKDNLLEKEKARDFYLKYQQMIIKFNYQKSAEQKRSIAQQFYSKVSKDFNIDEFEMKDSYKLSVIPMIKAMNKMCKNLDVESTLPNNEIKEFNKKAYQKLEKLEEKLRATSIAYNALNETTNSTSSYEQYRYYAIEYLKEQNLYNIEEAQRDISNYNTYIENTSYTSDKNKDDDTNDNTNTDTNINTDTSNNNENKTNNQTDEKNKNNKKKKKKKYTVDIDKEPVVNPTEQPTETPIYEENNNTNDNDDDVIDEDQVIEIIPTDKPQDNNQNDNENNNQNNGIDFNDESIMNITTDPTGAVDPNEPLPDPNEVDSYYTYSIEDYIEFIVDDMANNPENYQNDEVNIYTK